MPPAVPDERNPRKQGTAARRPWQGAGGALHDLVPAHRTSLRTERARTQNVRPGASAPGAHIRVRTGSRYAQQPFTVAARPSIASLMALLLAVEPFSMKEKTFHRPSLPCVRPFSAMAPVRVPAAPLRAERAAGLARDREAVADRAQAVLVALLRQQVEDLRQGPGRDAVGTGEAAPVVHVEVLQ